MYNDIFMPFVSLQLHINNLETNGTQTKGIWHIFMITKNKSNNARKTCIFSGIETPPPPFGGLFRNARIINS